MIGKRGELDGNQEEAGYPIESALLRGEEVSDDYAIRECR